MISCSKKLALIDAKLRFNRQELLPSTNNPDASNTGTNHIISFHGNPDLHGTARTCRRLIPQTYPLMGFDHEPSVLRLNPRSRFSKLKNK